MVGALTGPIPAGWQEIPLADVCEITAGPSNSMIRQAKTDGVPIHVVAPKHLEHRRIVNSDTVMVANDAPHRLTRYQLVPGDLVCVRTGDLGKRALAYPEHEGWIVGTACFLLRTEPAIDARYLLHYLSHPAVTDWVARHASTATVPTLTLSTLRTLPVLVPPPVTQATISDIMDALDEKISLHREIVRETENLHNTLLPLLLMNR